MKLTLSVIKADVGSIGGHLAPSQRLIAAVRGRMQAARRGANNEASPLIDDYGARRGTTWPF